MPRSAPQAKPVAATPAQEIKVFCFFFSKKKSFLAFSGRHAVGQV
jgi:hypothetical protein